MQKTNPEDVAAEHENTRQHIHVSPNETGSGEEADLTTEAVRQGHTGDHLRYILAISVVGVVVAFIAAYWFFLR